MIFQNIEENEKVKSATKVKEDRIELDENELPKLSQFEELRFKFEEDKERKLQELRKYSYKI